MRLLCCLLLLVPFASGQTTPTRQAASPVSPRTASAASSPEAVPAPTPKEIARMQMIEDNLMSMADLAKANHIEVVMASNLPATGYPWRPGIDPVDKIRTVNRWIQDYCRKNGYVYLDYYSALVDANFGMKKDLTVDGVHPNAAGYRVMAPLAEKAIARALGANK